MTSEPTTRAAACGSRACPNRHRHYLSSKGVGGLEAQLARGEIGMQTLHFTTGDRLAGQLAALGVAA